jgi:hypothetical protein
MSLESSDRRDGLIREFAVLGSSLSVPLTKVLLFVIMSVPSSSFDVDILPAERFSYVLVDPGVLWNGVCVRIG